MNWYRKLIFAQGLPSYLHSSGPVESQTMTVIPKNAFETGQSIQVILNPSLAEVVNIAGQSQDRTARMAATRDGWYTWDGSQSTHADVLRGLGFSADEVEYLVDWGTDGPIVELKADRLLIWIPPESENSQMKLTWKNELIAEKDEDGGFNYYIDLSEEQRPSPSPIATSPGRVDRDREIDEQGQRATVQFNKMDRPSNPFYKDWN